MERVLVRKVTDLGAAVAEALDFLDYDFAGRRVWVKPNLLSPHPPEHGVTTDPELVRHVVRGLKRRRAASIAVADNPAGRHAERLEQYLAPTGVVEASEGCFHDSALSAVVLPLKSRFIAQVPVSSLLQESDVILNLPVFKTHALTILTGAVKNLFGIIPGLTKGHFHSLVRSGEQFAELLVDIYQAVPVPVLSIMDALRGMDGQSGPSGGRVLSIGKLLASRNPVAMDSVMAMMAGTKPARIPTNRVAAARGLGPATLEEIEVVGDFAPIPGFRVPSMIMAGGLTAIAGQTFYRLAPRLPIVVRKQCTQCRACVENCPVQAIEMLPLPAIDRHKCIKCYCCVEICPERAMIVPGKWRSLYQAVTGR